MFTESAYSHRHYTVIPKLLDIHFLIHSDNFCDCMPPVYFQTKVTLTHAQLCDRRSPSFNLFRVSQTPGHQTCGFPSLSFDEDSRSDDKEGFKENSALLTIVRKHRVTQSKRQKANVVLSVFQFSSTVMYRHSTMAYCKLVLP